MFSKYVLFKKAPKQKGGCLDILDTTPGCATGRPTRVYGSTLVRAYPQLFAPNSNCERASKESLKVIGNGTTQSTQSTAGMK